MQKKRVLDLGAMVGDYTSGSQDVHHFHAPKAMASLDKRLFQNKIGALKPSQKTSEVTVPRSSDESGENQVLQKELMQD